MDGVCVRRSFIRVDDWVHSSKTNSARTFHTPKGVGACDKACRQGHGFEHCEYQLLRLGPNSETIKALRRQADEVCAGGIIEVATETSFYGTNVSRLIKSVLTRRLLADER